MQHYQTITLTLSDLQEIVRAAGYRVGAASGDYGNIILAASIESYGPGTYSHPVFSAVYDRTTRWLTVSGRPPEKRD